MAAILVIVGVCMLGMFFCSLAEAALYSVSRGRIETLRRQESSAGIRLAMLRESVEEPISAILIVNTLAMTLGAIWSGALVEKLYGDPWMAVFSAVFTVLILFISEIVPKSLGVHYADWAAPKLAWPVQFLIWALWPFVKIAVLFTRLVGKSPRTPHPTEQDIISMALLSESGGKILAQEAKWIRNILRLNDIKTRDIMTPRKKIAQLPASMPLEVVDASAGCWRYSRVLLADDKNSDLILGLVLRRTVLAMLMKKDLRTELKELMRPIHFVSDERPSNELVGFFVKNRTQIAAVKNAAGALVGVVTMEDVLEDMIGAEIE